MQFWSINPPAATPNVIIALELDTGSGYIKRLLTDNDLLLR